MCKVSSFQKITATFIGFIIAMLVCRAVYAGQVLYVFLLWNLFLAWIPFQLSLLFSNIKDAAKWKQVLLLAVWLLFFPNALYIVTDLIHLDSDSMVPVWFDAVLIFMSSITGLMFAFASLAKVEIFLNKKMDNVVVKNVASISFFAGSFGVYLGRFLRWNSWDVLTSPIALSKEIAACFLFPAQNYKSWVVTILFTCFFSLLYFATKKLPGLLKEPGN
jgi:uncharacterized membrane protein